MPEAAVQLTQCPRHGEQLLIDVGDGQMMCGPCAAEDLGICGCGCRTPLVLQDAGAFYASGACRTRAWKLRTGYTDQRRGKASRNASGRRQRPPDLRIPYRKLLDALENEFTALGFDAPYMQARALLRALLTKRQRDAAREMGL